MLHAGILDRHRRQSLMPQVLAAVCAVRAVDYAAIAALAADADLAAARAASEAAAYAVARDAVYAAAKSAQIHMVAELGNPFKER
jgi:hypothetical protein